MAGKRWRSIVLSAGVALIVCLGAVACVTRTPWLTQPVASGSSSYFDSITATRAGYVQTMLSNSMSMVTLSEGELDALVQGYGGGYVLSVSESGSTYAGTELHVVDVVLGVTSVQDHMQGEGYTGFAAVECFRYRIGDVPYLISYAPIACPPDSPVAEQRHAQDWAAALAPRKTCSRRAARHGADEPDARGSTAGPRAAQGRRAGGWHHADRAGEPVLVRRRH